MAVTIKIPVSLRRFTEGNKYISTISGPFSEVLKDIKSAYPLLFKEITTDQGNLRDYILVFYEDEGTKDRVRENSTVKDGQQLRILLAVGGG